MTAAEDEALAERRHRALVMKIAGATYTAIGKHFGVSAATARKDVDAAKRAVVDESTREGAIAEQLTVIRDLRRAFYPLAVGEAKDIDAAKLIMGGLVRESELLGLDQPKRTQIGVGNDVQFAHTLLGLIEAVGKDAAKDLAVVARDERDVIDAAVVDDIPAIEPVEPRAAGGSSSPGPAAPPVDGNPFVTEKRHSDVSGVPVPDQDPLAGESWSNLAD